MHQSAFDFYGVLQKGLFDSYFSPERAAFPAEYRDEKGLWMMASATLNVIAYNKKMVAAADAPKSFWDLTGAKWKGQLLMDDNESKWMAGMMQYYGEAKTMELLRKLAAQDIQFRTGHSSHTNVARRRRTRRRGRRFRQRRRPFEKGGRADRVDRARAGDRSNLRRGGRQRRAPSQRRPAVQ